MEAYSPKDNIAWILCTRQQIDKKRGCGQIARTPKSESVFFSMLSDLSVRLHRLSILNEAVKHGGDLSAGRRTLRVKQIAGFSLHKTAADRPLHGRW